MPKPWLKRIRETGRLTVFNNAKTWAVPIHAAIKSFNALSLGVQLVAEKEEKDANIVLIGANGPVQYDSHGQTFHTPNFKPDGLHGLTSTLAYEPPKGGEIVFAVVFLPGKVKATDGQKEVIVVHELIHACGLDEYHDSAGIMVGAMKKDGRGLIEYLPDKGAKPMPPIRVGSDTSHKMKSLWVGDGKT